MTEAVEIREVDYATLEDAEHTSLARLFQLQEYERLPHAPKTPLELVARRLRNRPEEMIAREWIATKDGEVVGAANMVRWKSEGNPHYRETSLYVHPEHRRRGIGRSLAREIVRAAEADNDPELVIAFGTNDKVPAGGEIAKRLGAKEGLTNRLSELDLSKVDRAMVREWASIDPAGYRLEWIDGDVPQELVPNVLVAYDTMNTAPRGNTTFGDWRASEAQLRDWERIRRSNGGTHRLLLAIDKATGATAGFTEVNRHPLTGWIVGQQGTATVPAHRGHGIGKWLKAAMIERIWRDWPDARFIRTGNAYSNAPMLSINDRLGFTIVMSPTWWETDLPAVRAFVEQRG